jgi:hypothetical protein
MTALPAPAPSRIRTPSETLTGYWEGKGATWEKALDDAIRKLTRRSETEFWFVVDESGKIRGEATTVYSAELDAVKWNIPLPTGGIEAAVRGRSEKKKVTFPIVGTFANRELALQADGEADMIVPNTQFEFVISASVSLSGGFGAPASSPQLMDVKIPANGWSPFQGLKAPITKRPEGPLVAKVESSGPKYSIEWEVKRNPTYDLDALADELIVILEPRLEASLEAALEPKLEMTLETKLEPKLELTLKGKLEPRLELTLEGKLEPKLELTLEGKLEPKLELTLEGKLEPKLEAKLAPKLEAALKAKIFADVAAQFAPQFTTIQQSFTRIDETDKKQNDRLVALEGATLTVKVVDRVTGQPAPLASVAVRGPEGLAAQLPSTDKGVFALGFATGSYAIEAQHGTKAGSASVDLKTDQTVTISL